MLASLAPLPPNTHSPQLRRESASPKTAAPAVDTAAVGKLKDELAAKDARIKKLEAVRLTKDQCAALKKMKEEQCKSTSFKRGDVVMAHWFGTWEEAVAIETPTDDTVKVV